MALQDTSGNSSTIVYKEIHTGATTSIFTRELMLMYLSMNSMTKPHLERIRQQGDLKALKCGLLETYDKVI